MSQIEIPAAFSAFHILPKDEVERADTNMPASVAQAMMVFLSTNINNGENAQKCGHCVSAALKLFASGPNGNQKVSIGRACLCWNCGTCALPANLDDFPADKTDGNMPPFARCAGCGESEETNFIEIKQPDGTVVPFIQFEMQTGPADDPLATAAPAAAADS